MKAKPLLFLVILLFFLFSSCEKEELTTGSSDPELTDEDLAVLDSTQGIPLTGSTVVLPGGQTLTEYLQANDPEFIQYVLNNTAIYKSHQVARSQELLVAQLCFVGITLGQRDRYSMPDEGDNKPAQYGLAYSYGSKQYMERGSPPAGDCKAEVYGLDCSGYVGFIFNFCGIPLPNGPADQQRRPDTLLSGFRQVYDNSYDIQINDLGKIDPSDFETGDIIYWIRGERAYHIGMVLRGYDGTAPRLVVAHSTGSARDGCEKNYTSLKRGVCLSDLSELLDGSRGKNFSTNYRIVRFGIKQTNPCGNIKTVFYGGQTYHTVEIGNQCWLQENLNIGSVILGKLDQANNGITEKYAYDDNAGYCTIYGGLYQWNEAMAYSTAGRTQGICPDGWHIPDKTEWETLVNELGGSNKAGGKMKETGLTHWKSPNEGATNSSGFTALPGGTRWEVNGTYMWLGESAVFWSSTQYDGTNAWWTDLSSLWGYSLITWMDKLQGASVRCIKD